MIILTVVASITACEELEYFSSNESVKVCAVLAYDHTAEKDIHSPLLPMVIDIDTNDKKWFRWAVASLASSFILANEKRIQRKLTKFPGVYHQDTTKNKELVSLLSPVLLRKLRPSLFIGTSSILNTIYGALPSRIYNSSRFREVVKVSFDGAEIGLDWEIPTSYPMNDDIKALLLKGPIRIPVVLVLHGLCNDTSNGYVRAIMHSCTEKGYIAVGMNSRGCGGIKLTTPRPHHAAYTNDLRYVVKIYMFP